MTKHNAALDLLEALKRVDHTLTVHGHVDAETDLHAFIRDAIEKAEPAVSCKGTGAMRAEGEPPPSPEQKGSEQ